MIVKNCSSVWTQSEGKVIWQTACTAKMYAYKDVFGGFQATEMHLLVTLMDLFSLTADHIWVGFQSVMGPELKQTPSFG